MPDTIPSNLNLEQVSRQLENINKTLSKPEVEAYFLGLSETVWNHVILPVLIPVILSALGFYLGKLYANRTEKKKRIQVLKDHEKVLITWVQLLEKPIGAQAQHLRTYSTSLEDWEEKHVLDIVDLHLDQLAELSNLDMVSLFVTNKEGEEENKAKLLFNFQDQISLIRRKYLAAKELPTFLNEFDNSNSREWNVNMHDFRSIMQELVASNESLPAKEIGYQILQMHIAYQELQSPGMKPFWTNFLEKAGPVCNKYVNQFPTIRLMRDLMNCMVKLKLVYLSKKKNYKSARDQSAEAADSMMNAYNELAKASGELENLPFKRLMKIN